MNSTFWVYPVYRNGRYQDQAGGYDDKWQALVAASNAANSGWFCRVEVVERPNSGPKVHQVDKMGRRITNRNGRVVAVEFPGEAISPRNTIGEVR